MENECNCVSDYGSVRTNARKCPVHGERPEAPQPEVEAPARKPEGERPGWVRCDCVDANGNVWPDCTCNHGWRPDPRKPEGDAGQRKERTCFHSRTHADCESCRERNELLAARSAVAELIDELCHRANLLEEASRWPIGAGRQEFLADQAKALLAAVDGVRKVLGGLPISGT